MRIAARRRAEWLMSDDSFGGRMRRVRVGDARLEVVEIGKGDPIVLVPGLAGGWRLLAPLARKLAKRNRVILYGFRDEADPLSSRAVDEPSRVGRLVLSGVEARFRSTLASTIARRVLERFPLPSDNPFVNQFFNLFHGGKPEAGPLPRFIVERCWETDQGVMARRLAMLEDFDVSDRLWALDAPTLILAGTRDVVVPPARQESLAQSIAGARFATIEGAGHVGFLTHSEDVARQVERLCRGGRPSLA
jgi:pimeloyl-ACP methyl ester carboxylesterase